MAATPNSYGITDPPATGGNSATNFLQSLEGVLSNQGQGTFGQGQANYSAGVQDFAPAQDYWQSILSGNKAEMESAIAPEKSDILSQYRARRKQLAATGARSGGTNEATAQSEYSQAGDVAKLLQRLRPQAAEESAGIAGELAKLGLGETAAGAGETQTALNAALAQRGQNIQQQGMEFGLANTLIGSQFMSALI
jgi:hypothetical protein